MKNKNNLLIQYQETIDAIAQEIVKDSSLLRLSSTQDITIYNHLVSFNYYEKLSIKENQKISKFLLKYYGDQISQATPEILSFLMKFDEKKMKRKLSEKQDYRIITANYEIVYELSIAQIMFIQNHHQRNFLPILEHCYCLLDKNVTRYKGLLKSRVNFFSLIHNFDMIEHLDFQKIRKESLKIIAVYLFQNYPNHTKSEQLPLDTLKYIYSIAVTKNPSLVICLKSLIEKASIEVAVRPKNRQNNCFKL